MSARCRAGEPGENVLRLQLFGVPTLTRDGALLTGRVAQRHRLALLALLALAPGRRLSRDKLIARLWPESGTDRGRNLLKVSTYVVRSELGDAVLLSTGDELSLDAGAIEIDVVEFEAALEQAQWDRARELYRAPLLDGFFLTDSAEFEKWLDAERERLAGGYRHALEAAADEAAASGDVLAAAGLWKLRAAHDPYDSRVALRLMHALDACGNRAAAIQHAAIHALMLQEEFGVAGVPEVAALADRLRTEPPSAAPTHKQEPPPPQQATSQDPTTSRAPTTSRRKRWRVAAALVLVIGGAGAIRALWPSAAGEAGSIVVLPFVNMSADADYEYFSDGLTDEVITRLAAVGGLKVISRTSAMHYKGSTKPLPEIADELRVEHILEGSVREDGGRVRVTAQLIDARSDTHVWADSYEYDVSDSFRVQEQIAQQVAQALELELHEIVRRRLVRQGTRDAEAFQYYQRARFLWNGRTREGHERAIEYYNRALERDDRFADAYAGLAWAYLTGFQLNLLDLPEAEAFDRMRSAAERALALDDESADAHVAFAFVLMSERDWPGAAREFRSAIELNPGHATGRSWYSLLLRGMGRSDDALRESRRATELDPFAVVITYNHAWHCYHIRDYDCAIEQYERSLEITDYLSSSRGLALAFAQKGMMAEALRAATYAVQQAPHRPDFLADLAWVQAMAGLGEAARATLDQAKEQPLEAFNIARAHVALGEQDSAFVWLERASWRWPNRATRDDPALDPLRSDPRLARLARRVERELGIR